MVRISVFAIALGMVIMIISMATGKGLQKEIRNKLTGFSGHIQVQNYDANRSYEPKPVSIEQDFYPDITSWREGYTHIQAYGTKAGILKTEEDFEGQVLKGVGKDYKWDFFRPNMVGGNIPDFGGNEPNDSILISFHIAKLLELEMGQRVAMYFLRKRGQPPLMRYFYIGGIYETGIEEIDESYVIGDIGHLRRLNRWGDTAVGGFEVFIDDFGQLDRRAEYLRNNIPYNLEARSIRENFEHLFQWLDLFDLNIYIILIIMVVVAGINMVNSLLILILEKTRLIGLLKALGATNKSVRGIFLYQAGYLTLKGMMIGNVIGIGFCILQSRFHFIGLDQETYYVSHVPIHLDLLWLAGINVFTFALCTAALVLPSYLITSVSPVRAIRFD